MTGPLARFCAPFAGLVISVLPAHAEAPNVVVSIAPVHSLVASVMEGAGQPELLIAANISVHDFALKPSDVREIANADLVVWLGESLETYLVRPIETEGTPNLELLEAEGVDPRPFDAAEETPEEPADEGEDHGHTHDHFGLDPHVWLDPIRAAAIATAVADRLAEIDPENADLYRANAARTVEHLRTLSADFDERLTPVRDAAFITFHDAYSYFVERYHLRQVGQLMVEPEQRPGAASLRALRATIEAEAVTCAFAEPQFDPDSIRSLAGDSAMRVGVLDPLGADLEPGPALYERLLVRNVEAVVSCLGS